MINNGNDKIEFNEENLNNMNIITAAKLALDNKFIIEDKDKRIYLDNIKKPNISDEVSIKIINNMSDEELKNTQFIHLVKNTNIVDRLKINSNIIKRIKRYNLFSLNDLLNYELLTDIEFLNDNNSNRAKKIIPDKIYDLFLNNMDSFFKAIKAMHPKNKYCDGEYLMMSIINIASRSNKVNNAIEFYLSKIIFLAPDIYDYYYANETIQRYLKAFNTKEWNEYGIDFIKNLNVNDLSTNLNKFILLNFFLSKMNFYNKGSRKYIINEAINNDKFMNNIYALQHYYKLNTIYDKNSNSGSKAYLEDIIKNIDFLEGQKE